MILKNIPNIFFFAAICLTAASMADNKFPHFNNHEWWIFAWACVPYFALFILQKYLPIKRNLILSFAALVYFCVTSFLIYDSLYLHRSSANPEGLLVYIFLPVVQLGLIVFVFFLDFIVYMILKKIKN